MSQDVDVRSLLQQASSNEEVELWLVQLPEERLLSLKGRVAAAELRLSGEGFGAAEGCHLLGTLDFRAEPLKSRGGPASVGSTPGPQKSFGVLSEGVPRGELWAVLPADDSSKTLMHPVLRAVTVFSAAAEAALPVLHQDPVSDAAFKSAGDGETSDEDGDDDDDGGIQDGLVGPTAGAGTGTGLAEKNAGVLKAAAGQSAEVRKQAMMVEEQEAGLGHSPARKKPKLDVKKAGALGARSGSGGGGQAEELQQADVRQTNRGIGAAGAAKEGLAKSSGTGRKAVPVEGSEISKTRAIGKAALTTGAKGVLKGGPASSPAPRRDGGAAKGGVVERLSGEGKKGVEENISVDKTGLSAAPRVALAGGAGAEKALESPEPPAAVRTAGGGPGSVLGRPKLKLPEGDEEAEREQRQESAAKKKKKKKKKKSPEKVKGVDSAPKRVKLEASSPGGQQYSEPSGKRVNDEGGTDRQLRKDNQGHTAASWEGILPPHASSSPLTEGEGRDSVRNLMLKKKKKEKEALKGKPGEVPLQSASTSMATFQGLMPKHKILAGATPGDIAGDVQRKKKRQSEDRQSITPVKAERGAEVPAANTPVTPVQGRGARVDGGGESLSQVHTDLPEKKYKKKKKKKKKKQQGCIQIAENQGHMLQSV